MRVAVTLPVALGDLGEFIADVRALEAAGADTIWLAESELDPLVVLAALAAVTHRIRFGTTVTEPRAAFETLQTLSGGRVVTDSEEWTPIPVPPDRDSWSRILREQEAAGVTGILVQWDPRLIDLLRNPEPEDRSDLLMSTG